MNAKSLKTLFLILTLFIYCTLNVNAQNSGTISGTLADATNTQPLSFATVTLITKNNSQPAKNIQTDINGKFNFGGLANGAYTIRATYIGYLSITRDSLSITNNKKNIALGNLKMAEVKGVLKEVTVSSQRSQIKLGIDKKTFDVSQSLVSQGGSATDLLANVPSVQVDVDGNLSLRGSSNVRVLINGKPSTLTGSNLTDILQSIPASSIETIEVITNPSSKYDAEGQSGIINIVLKKNAQLGFTGSASATAGTQNTYNGTANLAYQTKKINIFGNYSYRAADRVGDGFIDKTVSTLPGITPATSQYTNQISNQDFNFKGQNIRSGIDFFLDDKNTLSFSDNINIRKRVFNQNGLTTITQNGTPYELQDQNNINSGSGTNVDLSLDFDHKFAKKQEELTANIGYSNDANNSLANLNTTTSNQPSSIYNNTTKGNQHNITLQADYTLPLKDGRFEAGYRTTLNKSDNNYIVDTLNSALTPPIYQYSPILSNDFVYKQNINAVYSNYQHQFGKFGIQGGVRLEDAHVNTQLTTNNSIANYKQDYFRVYPTLFLTEKLNDNETLQLSYSRRVARPNDRQLSPFLDVSNKQNYQQGNPNLMPEDTHSVELSYINYWQAVTLTSSLYYRLTNDNIQQIVTLPASGPQLSTFENIKSASNAGYELIAKVTASSALDLTANINAYYRYIAADPTYNVLSSSGYSYNGNLTANVKLSKKFGVQLRGDYQGAQVSAQGKMLALYGMDGGVKYDMTKSLSLSLNSRDIFNTRKFKSESHFSNQTFIEDQTSQRRFATRVVLFTLAYHIGSNNQGKKGKEKVPTETDTPDDPNGNGGGQGGNANAQGSLPNQTTQGGRTAAPPKL
jgi:outer membrane receptor protein involved in Fe transport